MLQQLEYEFGKEQVKLVRKEAKAYVQSILRKGWLIDYSVVVSGEGSLKSMFNHATALALYAHNPLDGFLEYARYLDHEYGRSKHVNRESILASLPSDYFEHSFRLREIGGNGNVSATALWGVAFTPLKGEGLQSVRNDSLLSDLQSDALSTWCHTGSIAETAELLGVEYKTAENAVGIARRKLRLALGS